MIENCAVMYLKQIVVVAPVPANAGLLRLRLEEFSAQMATCEFSSRWFMKTAPTISKGVLFEVRAIEEMFLSGMDMIRIVIRDKYGVF